MAVTDDGNEGGVLIAELLRLAEFIEQLNRAIEKPVTVADLFRNAFRHLHELIEFDVAASLMIEQTLDLFVSRREQSDDVVGERLVAALREIVELEMAGSLGTADVLPQGDFPDLPALDHGDGYDPIAVRIDVPLSLEDAVIGYVVLFRGEKAFTAHEATLLRIVSSHVMFAISSLRTRDQLRDLAEIDELTGVWNRRYIRRKLAAEVERARTYQVPLSVMMIDVDNLKPVNDRYGHGMGDVMLSELCGAIRDTLRGPDALARLGGDEFFLMLPHTDLQGARQLAGRLLDIVRAIEIPTNDGSFRPTISVGIATYVTDMTSAELMQRADDRLYDSKRAGKNRFSW